MKVIMVTGNSNKFEETEKIAKLNGVELERRDIDLPEIRGTLEEIVKDKARQAFEIIGFPIVCDDSGLFVNELDDFPGAFSKFVFEKIGNEGILKLLKNLQNRGAEFRCTACYFDGASFVISSGVVKGTVTESLRGSSGFGYDPIFLPEGNDKTFAEDLNYKMRVSHRKKAFTKLFSQLSK
ncbi:MAG: RdgB/HAM1 family non-canonical purine NTP pyrophosphatase [Candidatus Altiarchaeota archaeon]|nr:RdgB/HAM1 family non-canonical purine NTP pyrophosphatase [Candidatus Altiarchaeota archaeon]